MAVSSNRTIAFVPMWQQMLSIAAGILSVCFIGAQALGEYASQPLAWLSVVSITDFAPYMIWMAVFPILLGLGFLWWPASETVVPQNVRPKSFWSALSRPSLFLTASLFGFGVAAGVGERTSELPPRLHDEYSYLLQAETFLAGRVTSPSPPDAKHFDQFHVLNHNGVVASRYFPAVGIWLAPFVSLGRPIVAAWLAQGLTTGFMALAASRVSFLAGIVVAMLVGSSPGLVIFGNTLLSPSVAMMGLAIGWWAFQETFDTGKRRFAVITGLAIAWVFLARPLTAFAIAGPWGLYALIQSLRSQQFSRGCLLAMIIGFLPGPILMAAYNAAITGSVIVTPYGQYTAIYSPSHVYGFYNRTRGLAARGPDTIKAYDDWVQELTPRSAADISVGRWRDAMPWIAGIIPVAILATLGLLQINRIGDRLLLPWLSIAGLTFVHVPFFFDGVLGWSYIAESSPFLLLIMGIATARVSECWWHARQKLIAAWWLAPIVIAMALSFVTTLPAAFDQDSELVYPRRQAAQRRDIENQFVKPCLILFDIDPKNDLHSTYVYNHPSFNGPILRAWGKGDTSRLMAAFPDRAVYQYSGGKYRRIR